MHAPHLRKKSRLEKPKKVRQTRKSTQHATTMMKLKIAAMAVLYMGASYSTYACPNSAPCNCSPQAGARAFAATCASADAAADAAAALTAACAAALVESGINTTLLARTRTQCGFLQACVATDAGSCTALSPMSADLTRSASSSLRFCTGKCSVQNLQVARVVLMCVASLCAGVLMVCIAYICVITTRNVRRAPRRQHRSTTTVLQQHLLSRNVSSLSDHA